MAFDLQALTLIPLLLLPLATLLYLKKASANDTTGSTFASPATDSLAGSTA